MPRARHFEPALSSDFPTILGIWVQKNGWDSDFWIQGVGYWPEPLGGGGCLPSGACPPGPPPPSWRGGAPEIEILADSARSPQLSSPSPPSGEGAGG